MEIVKERRKTKEKHFQHMDKKKLNRAPEKFQLSGLRLSSSCGLGALSGPAPSKRVFYCEWPNVELKDF